MVDESERDLGCLVRDMNPFLQEQPFVFCTILSPDFEYLPFEPLGVFREDEGVTVIAPVEAAVGAGLAFSGLWAHITLRVDSALDAVGFIAAVASELARAGISVNPVSAFHHDHLFVPWERREEALQILVRMAAHVY